ncbi:MAG: MATE family efflux transporter [Clostridia bacterium]|nr:MATE family efflux transporter [Clostridia bacterium]
MSRIRNAFGELFRDKDFQSRMLRLAVPMALASILSSSLQIVDTLMVATLGDIAVAAVSYANKLTYILSFFTAGIASGASIFCAQYWGDKSREGLGRTMGLSLLLLVPITLLFSLVAILCPQWVMKIFFSDPVVVAEGCVYLRWMGAAYVFQGLAALLAAAHKSTERPNIPMVSGVAGIVSNVILNYVLIFGKLGLPAMGVKGAAIATLLSAIVETVAIVVLAQIRKAPISLRASELRMPTRDFTGKYLKVTVPVLFNDVGWALGIVAMTWVYSTMGTAAAAAAGVYETIKGFVVVFCVSIGTAGGILLGIELGGGRREAAEKMSRQILCTAVLMSAIVTPVMLVLINPLLKLYGEMSAQALHDLRGMLIALAVCFVIKSFCFNLINGILRAGGDTKAAATIDVGCLWGIAVPLVILTGYVFKWNIVYVFPFTFFEEAVVLTLAFRRYRKGYWLKKLG